MQRISPTNHDHIHVLVQCYDAVPMFACLASACEVAISKDSERRRFGRRPLYIVRSACGLLYFLICILYI